MDRKTAIDWIEQIKHRIYGGDEDFDRQRKEALDMAIVDMKICNVNSAGWISVKDRLPESGKHVLVCCEIRPSKKKYVCDGFYASKHSISAHYVDDDIAYEYDEETDEYFLLEGWYEVIKNWEEYTSVVIDDFVTYWMPMPELPKEG